MNQIYFFTFYHVVIILTVQRNNKHALRIIATATCTFRSESQKIDYCKKRETEKQRPARHINGNLPIFLPQRARKEKKRKKMHWMSLKSSALMGFSFSFHCRLNCHRFLGRSRCVCYLHVLCSHAAHKNRGAPSRVSSSCLTAGSFSLWGRAARQ